MTLDPYEITPEWPRFRGSARTGGGSVGEEFSLRSHGLRSRIEGCFAWGLGFMASD